MVTAKDCYALTSYFEKVYKAKYGTKPAVNKYSARWGFDAILQGESPDDIKSLIDYYLSTTPPQRHDLDRFFRTYHKLIDAREEEQADREARLRVRRESAERARKWKERLGHQGITDD
jgi:hypothetical protein